MAEGNIAYLAQVALTEAGVPSNQITEAMTEEAVDKIVNHFKEVDKATYDENPVKAPFLMVILLITKQEEFGTGWQYTKYLNLL